MKVHFKGGRELEAALRDLGKKATAKNVARRALRKAAEPIREEAVRLAPDDPATGQGRYLKEAIQIGLLANRRALVGEIAPLNRADAVYAYVGINPDVLPPRDSKTKKNRRRSRFLQSGGGVASYSQFMEFGTATHAAQPFMRPAWEDKKQEAFDRLADDLRVEIDKAAARAARKAARQAG